MIDWNTQDFPFYWSHTAIQVCPAVLDWVWDIFHPYTYSSISTISA